MELQIWSKSEDKFAYILVLRGVELYRLKVTGNVLTMNRNLKKVLESLQEGKPPAEAGAKSVESLDTRTITKAEVSPDKGSLTLHGGEAGTQKLSYSTGDSNADIILSTIVAQSGHSFESSQEEIGVIEALIPPGLSGLFLGFVWLGIYMVARSIEAGEALDETSGRKRGLKQLLKFVAEFLGTKGSIALGVVLLVLVVGWAANRIIKRPKRTVWLRAAL